jgi:hypothetical protein
VGLAAVVVVAVVALVVLMGFAYDCADTCAGRAADDSSLEAAAEERAKNSSATCSDESSFAGANAALITVAVIVATVVVVLTTAAAIADSIIEVGISVVLVIPILAADGKNHCSQHQRGDEYRFAYLHHLELDADFDGRGKRFFLDFGLPANVCPKGGVARFSSSSVINT